MEEENKQDGIMQQTGDKIKQGAKEQAKQAKKKIIKKVIKALAPILLKFLLIIFIALLVFVLIDSVLEKLKSSEFKEVMGGALDYSYIAYSGSQSEEKSGYKIIPSIDSSVGGYKLDFSFFDEEKNEVSPEQVLDNIKAKLEEENISYSELTETNLKIIAVLEKNGLDLTKYSQEELKCLPMFIKAEIATQNFDLREHIEAVNSEEILDNDLIYGTLYAQRTSVVETNGIMQESHLTLKYMEYESFKQLEEANNIEEAKKYFSLDEEGNLLVAKWRTESVNVSYLDENKNHLSEDKIAKIPEENKVTSKSNSKVTIFPIDYKNNINKYSLNSGFLLDLLIATENAPFCADLCHLAFNSKVVIDFREEKTTYEEHADTIYNNIDLICDYAKYEIIGTHNTTGETTRKAVTSGEGNPEDSAYLKSLGWNANVNHTVEGKTTTYTWSNNKIDYELVHIARNIIEIWRLYMYDTETSSEYLPIQSNIQAEGNGEIIIGGQEEEFEKKDYTNKDEWKYIVHVDTYTTNNLCFYEISEIDCWFTKYKKEYNTPEIISTPYSSNSSDEGGFQNTSKDVITDQDPIQQKVKDNSIIKAYVEEKEQKYKNTYPDAENVTCTIKELTEEIWEKANKTYQLSSNTTKYKYGEENADTTKIILKNIAYKDNVPEFDDKDIGFLSIYDKYLKNGEDLFLKQDAEKSLFQMLEEDDKTRGYSDLLKGLLYGYDHIDRGVTDLSSLLDVFKVNEFKKVKAKGSAIVEWLRSYEFNPLRELRNGRITLEQFQAQRVQPNTVRINDEGKYEYNAYELLTYDKNGKIQDHSLNYSYGIRVYDLETNSYGNEGVFSEEGVNLQEIIPQFKTTGDGWLDADTVDRVQIAIVNEKRETIKEIYEAKGVNLEKNEIDALIAMGYAYGDAGAGITNFENIELVRKFKNEEITKESLINSFHGTRGYPFSHSNRGLQIQLMFFEGRYILSTGEEIDPNAFGGSLADWDGETYSNDLYTFPVYDQHSDSWGSLPFGGPRSRPNVSGNNGQQKTISSSGCGCCSLAAILSGYTGEAITPDLLTEILDSTYTDGRYYSPGEGSCDFYYSDSKLLNNFNCSGETCTSFSQATKALKEGYAVIGAEDGHMLAFVPASSEDSRYAI